MKDKEIHALLKSNGRKISTWMEQYAFLKLNSVNE